MSEEKFVCQYCGKEYKDNGNKSKHEKSCDLNPNKEIYICKYCGKNCLNKNGLSTHENSCKDNPNRIIKIRPKSYTTTVCDKCGKEITNCNFKKHYNSCCKTCEKAVYHLDHDDLICKWCGKECKNINSLAQHECRCKENPDAYNIVTIDKSGICQYCGKYYTGVKYHENYCKLNPNHIHGWNKGLTKDTDERVQKQGETYSKHYKDGLIKSMAGDNNPGHREDVRQKISKTCLEKSKNGEWHKSLAKDMHYQYNDMDLDGTWELKYAQYLDNNRLNYIRCKDRFPYEFEGNIHYYTPDFYLIDNDTYVEVKGYKTNKDIAKWEQFPKDKKLVIYQYDELKNLDIL